MGSGGCEGVRLGLGLREERRRGVVAGLEREGRRRVRRQVIEQRVRDLKKKDEASERVWGGKKREGERTDSAS